MFVLRLLGGAWVEGPEGHLTGPITQRHNLALLAFLARAPNGLVSRDKVVAYLWQDAGAGKARRSLSNALYVVRNALGENAVVTIGDDVGLNRDLVQADATAFEQAAEEGRLEEAVALYTGPFLDGVHVKGQAEFAEWVEGERRRLKNLQMGILEALASSARERGDRGAEVAWWRKLATEDPYAPRFALGLMEALAATGNAPAAIRHAEVYAQLIESQFGGEPDPAVLALAEALRAHPEAREEAAGGERERPPPDQTEREAAAVPTAPALGARGDGGEGQGAATIKVARPQANAFQTLVHEAHRRSLWQVLVLYLGASWGVLEAADQVIERFGMPDWAYGAAVLLLLIGFPIVMATAIVQEGMGGEANARTRMEDDDGRTTPPSTWGRVLTWRNAIGGGVIAFALWGVIATALLLGGDSGVDSSAETTVPGPSPGPARGASSEELLRVVAVLPFENLSADAENAYFADGIHEDILSQLSKIADLTVLSRQAVLRYRDSEEPITRIGRELGVGSVLEGSVRRDEETVRVTAQLIDVATDAHLWAETYDRELSVGSIFAIQSEIAERVASALQAELTPAEIERVTGHPTDDLEAYDYYTRGRVAYERYTRETNEEAIRLFRSAIALDPDYGVAWAGLAIALRQRYDGVGYAGTDSYHSGEWLDSAETAARRAISLDPDASEAYRALGTVFVNRRMLRRCADLNLQAIERDPNNWAAATMVGACKGGHGQSDESIRWMKRALRLDPLGWFPRWGLIQNYSRLGEFEISGGLFDRFREQFPDRAPRIPVRMAFDRGDAAAAYELASQMRDLPDNPGAQALLAQAAVAVGRFGEAEQSALKALELVPDARTQDFGGDPRHARGFLGYARLRTGRLEAGTADLDQLLSYLQEHLNRGADDPSIVWEMAAVHAALGHVDEALDLVEQAYEAGFQPGRGYPTLDPMLDSIRDRPRFQAVMVKSRADLEAMRRTMEAEEIAAGER